MEFKNDHRRGRHYLIKHILEMPEPTCVDPPEKKHALFDGPFGESKHMWDPSVECRYSDEPESYTVEESGKEKQKKLDRGKYWAMKRAEYSEDRWAKMENSKKCIIVTKITNEELEEWAKKLERECC
jgi:hypothetical protein